MEPTIVAIGGAGLSEERDGKQLEDYILGLTGKPSPRVCNIPTASGDSPVGVLRFYSVMTVDRCQPSHLQLFDRKIADLRGFLLSQDVIYVGGGNTNAMLAVWRQHGVDEILREAWERGIVLCGSSAGANCWHEASTTDSWGLPLRPLLDGLGFIPGSFSPHYDAEVTRRPLYQQWISEGSIPDGYACDNSVAIHYEGTRIAGFVSSRPDARAWRLEKTTDGFRETEVVPRFLGT
jgi:peptidase E